MTREVLFLDLLETEEQEGAPPRMRLVVKAYPSDEKGYASLTPECNTMEGFEQAVAELKKRMDSALERARETFQQYQAQARGEKAVSDFHNPEEIWQALEECSSLEEMRELFNGLSVEKRQEVADFVLTQLNIFKGAASTFSQHYNEVDYLLE
jgi:hypothetical protein